MYLGGLLMKGCIFLKKILIVFVLLIALLMCSCRRINQQDTDTNYTGSNSSELNSDISEITSQITTPNTSVSVDTSRPEPGTSSNEDNTSNETVAKVDLAIDTDNPYYKTTVKTISFTLYNNYKSRFTYYSDFFLQIYINGDWKYYPTADGEINYQFKKLESDSYVTSYVFDLRNLYNLPLPVGTYRIIQQTDDAVITSRSFEVVDDSFFGDEQEQ